MNNIYILCLDNTFKLAWKLWNAGEDPLESVEKEHAGWDFLPDLSSQGKSVLAKSRINRYINVIRSPTTSLSRIAGLYHHQLLGS